MTNWWNKYAESRVDEFKSWVGDFNQDTKVYCRNYVASKNYKTIIDCGCGLATEFYGYKNDNYDIKYTGIDSCDFFINTNKNNGIEMIVADLEKPLLIKDDSYECAYCSEVIEHLVSYEQTINEFIRISNKEVLIVWFIKPYALEDGYDIINYYEEEDVYHNTYDKEKLEKFILKNPKVNNLFWQDINDKKSVLHIIIKNNEIK